MIGFGARRFPVVMMILACLSFLAFAPGFRVQGLRWRCWGCAVRWRPKPLDPTNRNVRVLKRAKRTQAAALNPRQTNSFGRRKSLFGRELCFALWAHRLRPS